MLLITETNFGLPSIMTMRRKCTISLLGLILTFIFEAYGYPHQFFVARPKMSVESLQVIDFVPDCEHKTFCESTPYYPTKMVIDALKKNPHLHLYANADEMQTFLKGETFAMDVPGRMDGEPEEEPLCVSTEKIVLPKLGITKDSEWMYIVNHENLTQTVRIEVCLEEEKPCRVIEGFAEGYATKCKQKYIYRQLLAVASNGLINRYSFQFPASCCCHIEFQGDRFLKNSEYN